MTKGKIVLGTLAGLAAGTLVGVLFAPQKGSATRRAVKDKKNEFLDGINSKFNDVVSTISNRFEQFKDDAQHLEEKGKNKFEDLKKDAEHTAENVKHDILSGIQNKKYQ